MSKRETLQKISDIRRRCGETRFRMAIQHLFDTGHQNFHEKEVAAAKVEIKKNTLPNAILTAGFQCELLDCCLELSRLPIWDILLYVKLYLDMEGADLLLLEEAGQALNGWNSFMAPSEWKEAVANPDTRDEILQEMMKQHGTEYTKPEIESAIRCVAEAS